MWPLPIWMRAERCNRVALMYRGAFIKTGEPREVKSLIGKPLLQIKTGRPHEAESVLKGTEPYHRVIRTGSALRLFVNDEKADTRAIRRILKESGNPAGSVERIEPTLEDTFVEVIASEGEMS